MFSENRSPDGKGENMEIDKITIKTPSSTYSFTQSWVENEELNGILVGLIADDLNRQQNADFQ